MAIEYIIFLWPLSPWARSALNFILRRSEKSHNERLLKRKARTALQNSFIDSTKLLAGSAPYIGAYFYADLKLIWLTLGIVYIFSGLLIFTMGILVFFTKKYHRKEIEQHKLVEAKSRKENHWPKWQVKLLCLFQYTVLMLWLYSWRHIIDYIFL